jgi:hypothetical protein
MLLHGHQGWSAAVQRERYTRSMICAECGSEFREGFTRCRACDVDLVEPAAIEPAAELIKVYESGNAALIPLFESLLDSAEIEYMTKGEGIQDLFGWGRFGTNLNYVIGPVEFYVRAEDAEEATRIAESLGEEIASVEDDPERHALDQ